MSHNPSPAASRAATRVLLALENAGLVAGGMGGMSGALVEKIAAAIDAEFAPLEQAPAAVQLQKDTARRCVQIVRAWGDRLELIRAAAVIEKEFGLL